MTQLRPKQPRFRLDPEAYRKLHRSILERDRWHCQVCGAMATLEVHHLESRGRLGDDSEQNLITLCHSCHDNIHRLNFNRSHSGEML